MTALATLLAILLAPQNLTREQEQRILQDAVSQGGNSPVEFIRAGERHLYKHPQSKLREDLERAILRAAIDVRDHARILRYGERVLARDAGDPSTLDHVARSLLESDDAESARKGLGYAERMEKAAAGPQDAARAQSLQARALGNLGQLDKAIAKAVHSYQTWPTGEAAREAGRWEMRAGRLEDALTHYADAFAIPDPKVTVENRAHHRAVLGEIYVKLHGSEAGLGDVILKAYDRTSESVRARESQAKPAGPNQGLQDAFEFRLSGLRGDTLHLASLRGKVLVLDFWATWCAPCRVQHPMLEQIKMKYKHHPEVAFVSISTDSDRALVRPFLQELQWPDEVYFEDGLALFYRVSSIPTLMVFNRRGELVSRVPGFPPSGYSELVTAKIEEARAE